MAGGIALRRPGRKRGLISMVPMIDVMLILLVFFMVTSTYLNLDMIPAAQRSEDVAPPVAASGESGATLLIRLGSDGVPVLRGQALPSEDLQAHLRAALAEDPLVQVLILPSPTARTQALVSLMETATQAGVARLRVVRLEAEP